MRHRSSRRPPACTRSRGSIWIPRRRSLRCMGAYGCIWVHGCISVHGCIWVHGCKGTWVHAWVHGCKTSATHAWTSSPVHLHHHLLTSTTTFSPPPPPSHLLHHLINSLTLTLNQAGALRALSQLLSHESKQCQLNSCAPSHGCTCTHSPSWMHMYTPLMDTHVHAPDGCTCARP